MTVDILRAFYGNDEKKTSEEMRLEKLESIAIRNLLQLCFGLQYGEPIYSSLATAGGGKVLLQSSLKIEILKNVQDGSNRNCLLIQLSFFDIDLLNEDTSIQPCADRLRMAFDSLRILNFLFSDSILDWCRRIFTHLIDVFSTILAKHVTRKCQILIEFDKEKIYPICETFQPTVTTINELSKILFDAVEDQAPIEKMVFSFNVVVVLEEEIDEILRKVEDLHCEKRDTAIERSGIREAHFVLQQLNEYLEENCMESAVESSNLDSLKMLARNLSTFEKRLDGTMSTLPE